MQLPCAPGYVVMRGADFPPQHITHNCDTISDKSRFGTFYRIPDQYSFNDLEVIKKKESVGNFIDQRRLGRHDN